MYGIYGKSSTPHKGMLSRETGSLFLSFLSLSLSSSLSFLSLSFSPLQCSIRSTNYLIVLSLSLLQSVARPRLTQISLYVSVLFLSSAKARVVFLCWYRHRFLLHRGSTFPSKTSFQSALEWCSLSLPLSLPPKEVRWGCWEDFLDVGK